MLLRVKRLHSRVGLPKWVSRPTGMPVALRELPQRVQSGFQRSRPPDIPPPHHRGDPPGSAGVPPACYPIACRSVSLRCGTRPPCRRERHGPGRSRVLAPLPVDPGGGDDRGCAKTCAGGTPALPGGLHPMTSSHQRRFIGLRVHQKTRLTIILKNSTRLRQKTKPTSCSPWSWWRCAGARGKGFAPAPHDRRRAGLRAGPAR